MDPVPWHRRPPGPQPGCQPAHRVAQAHVSVFGSLTALALVATLATPASAASFRRLEGRDVRLDIPAGADRSRFQPTGDGRLRYVTTTRVKGLGRLSVTIGSRGDPEATLQMELQGFQACARMPAFKKDQVKCMDMNRSVGVVGLQTRTDGVRVAHAATWSRERQFELMLEATQRSVDPLNHPVFRRMVETFRSREAPLKHAAPGGAKP